MMHLVKGEPPKGRTTARAGYFLLNRDYIRGQANEAIRLFFAPAAGVFTAVTGRNPRITSEDKRKI